MNKVSEYTSKQIINEIKQIQNNEIKKDEIEYNAIDRGDGVYLFVSFDIVNSTKYKSIEVDWPMLINKFYEESKQKITNINEEFKEWKLIGDEVLFYLRLNDIEEIVSLPRALKNMMDDVNELLNNVYPFSRGLIYIKGTVFIANLSNMNIGDDEIENETICKDHSMVQKNRNYIMESIDRDFSGNESYNLLKRDFLGPDIDLGFRLTKHTYKNQLLLSLEVVYLISEYLSEKSEFNININDNFRIINLVELKGIWQERKYPIIWYRESKEDWKPNRLFHYDDNYYSSEKMDFYRQAYNNNENIDLKETLKEILVQSGKMSNIDIIKQVINNTENRNTPKIQSATGSVSPSRITEVHYILIGVTKDNKIALFRKEINDGKQFYDCGCVHSSGFISVDALLKKYYEDFFEIDSLLKNEASLPQPISMYEYYRDQKICIPGFVFVARINNLTNHPSDYNHHELFNLDELNELNTYEDLKINIRLAVELINKKESI